MDFDWSCVWEEQVIYREKSLSIFEIVFHSFSFPKFESLSGITMKAVYRDSTREDWPPAFKLFVWIQRCTQRCNQDSIETVTNVIRGKSFLKFVSLWLSYREIHPCFIDFHFLCDCVSSKFYCLFLRQQLQRNTCRNAIVSSLSHSIFVFVVCVFGSREFHLVSSSILQSLLISWCFCTFGTFLTLTLQLYLWCHFLSFLSFLFVCKSKTFRSDEFPDYFSFSSHERTVLFHVRRWFWSPASLLLSLLLSLLSPVLSLPLESLTLCLNLWTFLFKCVSLLPPVKLFAVSLFLWWRQNELMLKFMRDETWRGWRRKEGKTVCFTSEHHLRNRYLLKRQIILFDQREEREREREEKRGRNSGPNLPPGHETVDKMSQTVFSQSSWTGDSLVPCLFFSFTGNANPSSLFVAYSFFTS